MFSSKINGQRFLTPVTIKSEGEAVDTEFNAQLQISPTPRDRVQDSLPMTTFAVRLTEEHFIECLFRMRQFNAADKTGLRRWLAIHTHIPIEFKWTPATEAGDPQASRRRPLVGTPSIIAMWLIFALPLLLIEPIETLRTAAKILVALVLGLLAIVILFWLISQYVCWNLRKGVRKSPFHNSRIEIQLDQTGLESRGAAGADVTAWSAFPAVCRFDDGFLLQKPGNEFIWLPFAAITGGSLEEAEQLVQENIANHRVYGKAK